MAYQSPMTFTPYGPGPMYGGAAAPATPPAPMGMYTAELQHAWYDPNVAAAAPPMPPLESAGAARVGRQSSNDRIGLNPAAKPFVVPGSPVDMSNSPSVVVGNQNTGTKTPVSPGKRTNNPYGHLVAVPSEADDSAMATQTSDSSFVYARSSSFGMSPITPPQAHQQAWPVVGGPSPIAAPLPTMLPPRDPQMNHAHNHHSHGHGHGQHHNGPRGGRGNGAYSSHAGPHQHHNAGPSSPATQYGNPIGFEEVIGQAGNYIELARSANGSSFIQAAVKEGSDPNNLAFIWTELYPSLGDLLLDAHGCYVIKSVMERLPHEEMNRTVATIAADPQLVFSMCTHSLHTRRVVQYLLDTLPDSTFIIDLLTRHISEIAMTQQGCIVMQRAMDVAQGRSRAALYHGIYQNLVRFAMDPFANYVVQHLLEVGDRAQNSQEFSGQFLQNCIELSCNKFASNVMEKALFHLDEATQHNLLFAIYSSGEDALYRMLQDSFGNYLIQSSIALAPYQDVQFMADKLRPVLQRTPYGHKIEGRLERRLKGKAVGTRSSAIGSTFKSNAMTHSQQRRGPGQGQGQSQTGHNSFTSGGSSSFSGSDNGEEEPW